MIKTADVVEASEMPLFDELVVLDEVPHDSSLMVEEPKQDEKFDLKKNPNFKLFIPHMNDMLKNIPTHSGKTTAGCERLIAYLDAADRLISQAVAADHKGEIDDVAAEEIRKEIRKMKRQVKKRYNEINEAYDADDAKYASTQETEIVKEATEVKPEMIPEVIEEKVEEIKTAAECSCKVEKKVVAADDENCPTCKIRLWKADENLMECISCDQVFERQLKKEATTPRVSLVMSPWERAITGIVVNAVVSQGKKAEDVYAELKKQYKFSERDELGLMQLLTDLGFPVMRNLMAVPHGNIEFSTQYNA